MFLICGIGNPGSKYEMTRHNIGWLTIDRLREEYCPDEKTKEKKQTQYWQTSISGEKAILAKPLTYVNLSGQSVSYLKTFYKIDPDKIIIITDDINLPFGSMKIKPKGSSGGHNGLKSIEQVLGQTYLRIRMGVANSAIINMKDFVLSRFSNEETKLLEKFTRESQAAVECLIQEGIEKAMTRFNNKSISA